MIKNLGLLEILEVESPNGFVQLVGDKQFRNRDNFNGKDLYSVMGTKHLLPGFCFKRKADGYTWDLNSPLTILDSNLNTVYSIPYEQVEIYTTSDGYEYWKLRPTRPYNISNNDGDAFLDDGTYMRIKPFEMPCGWYCFYMLLTNGAQQVKSYVSEMFQLVDAEPATHKINLITNGSFYAGLSGWTTAGTWTVDTASGIATNTSNAGNTYVIRQTIAPVIGMLGFKVSFTISDLSVGGNIEAVAFLANDPYRVTQRLRIAENGDYVFYADQANIFAISVSSNPTFSLSNVKIEMVIGFENYVTLATENDCRGANNTDFVIDITDNSTFGTTHSADSNYYDFTLLEAEILQPEYGEELKQEENGNLEKITSFARPFKIFDLSPLLLPEFVIDFFASLNSFDTVKVHDGKLNRLYICNTTVDETEAISINNFKPKAAWQDGDVYALLNLSFEKNLAIRGNCCDEVTLCPCVADFEFEIQSRGCMAQAVVDGSFNGATNVITITSVTGGTPGDLTGLAAGQTFVITNSDTNDATLTIVEVNVGEASTTIEVSESITTDITDVGFTITGCLYESGTSGVANIQPVEDFPCGAVVELFVQTGESELDCNASGETTGISITTTEFNANGINYQIVEGNFYCFYVKIWSPSCTYDVPVSNRIPVNG